MQRDLSAIAELFVYLLTVIAVNVVCSLFIERVNENAVYRVSIISQQKFNVQAILV